MLLITSNTAALDVVLVVQPGTEVLVGHPDACGCFSRRNDTPVSVVVNDPIHSDEVCLVERDVHSLALFRTEFHNGAVVLARGDILTQVGDGDGFVRWLVG